jgi:hypothetical protein
MSKLIINANHDILQEEDVQKYCTRHRKTYLCPQQTIAVHHDQPGICLTQLVLTHYTKSQPATESSHCELFSLQQYLMQEPRVYVTSPNEEKIVTMVCTSSDVSQNDSLPTGLNLFTLERGCRLETSSHPSCK